MNTTTKFFALFLVAFILSIRLFAQNSYQTTLNNIYNINPTKITTGIFIERAPVFVDIGRYSKSNNDKDTCNVYKWQQLYYQVYLSHLNMQQFACDSLVLKNYPCDKTVRDSVPLGILFYEYNKFKPDALSNGMLSVDTLNNKVYDNTGVGGTPLKLDTCFIVSPMVEALTVGTYSFYIDPTLFMSNKIAAFDQFFIDFADGRGYLLLPANGTVTASFHNAGIQTLKIKAVKNSMEYIACAAINVEALSGELRSDATYSEKYPDEFDNYFHKAGIIAEYGIWYRCGHDNTIRKPFLIVSGFDPGNNIRVKELQADGNKKDEKLYLYHAANKDGFLDRLRENGYDIIAYRSTHSTNSIVSNALNLIQLIRHINTIKTSNHELVIVGASMGGLVVRYALTHMEYYDVDHQTRLFISLDSPQNGANIPLGVQHMVAALNADFNGKIDQLKNAKEDQLGCVAAKQMLLYHNEATNKNTNMAYPYPYRNVFLNDLASMGNFPQKCQSIAISMGSGTGTGQGFNAGSLLIEKKSNVVTKLEPFLLESLITSLFFSIPVPGTLTATLTSTSWTIKTYAVPNANPNQNLQTIYDEELSLFACIPVPVVKVKWSWLFMAPVVYTYIDLVCNPSIAGTNIKIKNTYPIDNAPGSKKGVHNLADFNLNGLDKTLSDLGILKVDGNYDCFIPSYSALGLSVSPHTHIKNYLASCSGVEKINNNNRFYRNYNKTVSPFDYLYIEESNMYHIADPYNNSALTSSMISIMEELLIPAQLNIGDKTINSGQSVAYEAAENITVDGNFIVEPGGNLDMRAAKIVLKPGFHAKAGSTVSLKADVSWICPAGSIQSVSLSPLSSLVLEEIREPEEEQLTQLITPEVENEVRFFPNPVENILNIQILNKVEGEIKIAIVDAKGQIVYSQSILNNIDNPIDCSQFSSGIYFINVATNNSIQKNIKIIKK